MTPPNRTPPPSMPPLTSMPPTARESPETRAAESLDERVADWRRVLGLENATPKENQ